MKRPAHRPSSEDVDRSIWSMKTKRHYSQDMMRKVEMGRRAFAKGEDPHTICLRLFGTDSKEFINLISIDG